MRLASVCYWCRRRLSCNRSEGLVFGAFSKRSSQLKRKLCVRSERQQSPHSRPQCATQRMTAIRPFGREWKAVAHGPKRLPALDQNAAAQPAKVDGVDGSCFNRRRNAP